MKKLYVISVYMPWPINNTETHLVYSERPQKEILQYAKDKYDKDKKYGIIIEEVNEF